MCFIRLFYPRSPCGERLLSLPFRAVRIVFYPRSPCGERRFNVIVHSAHPHFLSTLSLRRATPQYRHLPEHPQFSIHALLAESDNNQPVTMHTWQFSIHALLAESDRDTLYTLFGGYCFLSTLSLRRATTHHFAALYNIFFSIHALLAESD